MITLMPRASASLANSAIQIGVRCAETTCFSNGTPKRSRTSVAWDMVSQSDVEPMMTATRGSLMSSVGRRYSPWPSEYPRWPSKVYNPSVFTTS
jgi:hypothetical protein